MSVEDKMTAIIRDTFARHPYVVGNFLVDLKNGPDTPIEGFIAQQDAAALHHNPWDPGAWEAKGWRRNFGDAAVNLSWFEILMKDADPEKRADPHRQRYDVEAYNQFKILCPLLRRPITLGEKIWSF